MIPSELLEVSNNLDLYSYGIHRSLMGVRFTLAVVSVLWLHPRDTVSTYLPIGASPSLDLWPHRRIFTKGK